MSRWTEWRKIAEGSKWFPDVIDHVGPACYELGIGGPRARSAEPMYVGETDNERRRISGYARSGWHLKKEIGMTLRAGWSLYYRAQALPSREAARRMQNRLLVKYDYPLNIQGVPRERYLSRLRVGR